MTTYNKASLAQFFETGDVPQGADYANLIDSQVNIVETSVQNMGGPLGTTELITSRVSAGNINATGTLTVNGIISANDQVFVNSNVNVSGSMTMTGGLFAAAGNTSIGNSVITNGNLSVAGITSAALIYSQPGMISAPVNIAASGTTLGTANLLTNARLTILTAVTDGTATGVGLLSNLAGLQQYIYNDTAASANLWPCAGGQINNLASGAAFGMTAKTQYTILHTKASGYAVK